MTLSQQEQHQPKKVKTKTNSFKRWMSHNSTMNKRKKSFNAASTTNTSTGSTSNTGVGVHMDVKSNTGTHSNELTNTNEDVFTMNHSQLDIEDTGNEHEAMSIHTTSSSTEDDSDVHIDTPTSKTSVKSFAPSNEKDNQRTNRRPTMDRAVSETPTTYHNYYNYEQNIPDTSTTVVPISLLSLQQWTIYLHNQQKILQQFQNQNQIILNSIEEHLSTITNHNININNNTIATTTTTTATINPRQSDINSMSIPNGNSQLQLQSSLCSTRRLEKYPNGNDEYEPHVESNEIIVNPLNRVSLDRSTTPDKTQLTLQRDILQNDFPQQSKRNPSNQSVYNENTDCEIDENIIDSVQSTQTIDPTINDECTVNSSQQGSVCHSVVSSNTRTPKKRPLKSNTSSTYKNNAIIKNETIASNNPRASIVPKQNRFDQNKRNKSRENLKNISVTKTPPGDGWVSNQSARSFIMQMNCNNKNSSNSSSSPPTKENCNNSVLGPTSITKTSSNKYQPNSTTINNDTTTIQNLCSNHSNYGMEKQVKEEYLHESNTINIQNKGESYNYNRFSATTNHDNNNTSSSSLQLPFVYKEVVRNQTERQQLDCYDCVQCRKFYNALRRSGHDNDDTDLAIYTKKNHHHHHHDHTNDCTTTTKPIEFGRHRARYVPTETPTDFWELDFIDEKEM
jgi:hypothetical protein